MKRKKSSIGCLFWIPLVLLVLVIFLFNRKTIDAVLENTGFWQVVRPEGKEPEVERVEDDTQIDKEAPEETAPLSAPPTEVVPPEEETILSVPPQAEPELPETEAPKAPPEEETEGKLRRSRLYFVKIAADGNIALKGIVRPIYYRDSPLTETLANLLKGLSTSEINQGLLSLIPEGTVLRGVSVRNSVAFLDFSEEFLFNAFGREGYTAQLQQIIYSATEFSTVDRVQILINGQIKEYMGSEGGYIGQPIGRDSF